MSVPFHWHIWNILLWDEDPEFKAYQTLAMNMISPGFSWEAKPETVTNNYNKAMAKADNKLKFHLKKWYKYYLNQALTNKARKEIEEKLRNEQNMGGR